MDCHPGPASPARAQAQVKPGNDESENKLDGATGLLVCPTASHLEDLFVCAIGLAAYLSACLSALSA